MRESHPCAVYGGVLGWDYAVIFAGATCGEAALEAGCQYFALPRRLAQPAPYHLRPASTHRLVVTQTGRTEKRHAASGHACGATVPAPIAAAQPGGDRVMGDVLAVAPQTRLRVTGLEQADRKAVQPDLVFLCHLGSTTECPVLVGNRRQVCGPRPTVMHPPQQSPVRPRPGYFPGFAQVGYASIRADS